MSTNTPTERTMIHACVFERGGDLFGVEAKAVVQIMFRPQLTTVPAAPSFVRGAMNLRGEIVPVVAIDAEIGVESDLPFPARHPVLVLQTEFDLVAIPVERVLSVTRIPISVREEQVESRSEAQYVRAVCESHGRVVAMLDYEQMFRDLQQRVHST